MKRFLFLLLAVLLATMVYAADPITVPDKATNDKLTAAEFNQLLDALKDGTRDITTKNLNAQGGTFSGSVAMGTTALTGNLFTVTGTDTQMLVKTGVDGPNIVFGHDENTITDGTTVRSNTISGGGYTAFPNHIDGDETRYATIGGGYDNHIDGVNSTDPLDATTATIAGGSHITIKCTHATVGGGSSHSIGIGSDYSVIAGGNTNDVADGANHGTIGGGYDNTVSDDYSTVAGGTANTASGTSCTVAGGSGNTAGTGNANTVCGGINNTASGGNATVLGGTTNQATGQGSLAWGRAAIASARGSVCLTTDTTANYGLTNSVANSFAAKFDGGYRWYGGSSEIGETSGTKGALKTVAVDAAANITASATVTIAVNVPASSKLIGCQLRVDTALAAGELWDAAYAGGATQAIATAQAVAQNTKVNTFFNVNAATDITSDVTTIAITKNGGGSFTAQGTIRAIVYYQAFTAMADAS